MSIRRNPNFGILLVDGVKAPFLRSLSIALERRGGYNHLYRCEDSREAMGMIAREPHRAGVARPGPCPTYPAKPCSNRSSRSTRTWG